MSVTDRILDLEKLFATRSPLPFALIIHALPAQIDLIKMQSVLEEKVVLKEKEVMDSHCLPLPKIIFQFMMMFMDHWPIYLAVEIQNYVVL